MERTHKAHVSEPRRKPGIRSRLSGPGKPHGLCGVGRDVSYSLSSPPWWLRPWCVEWGGRPTYRAQREKWPTALPDHRELVGEQVT